MQELRKRRELLGISRMTLASLVEVSAMSIQLWETGGTKPSPENRAKLEKVLADLEKKQEEEVLKRRQERNS
jgi:predicted transcriptional regulator